MSSVSSNSATGNNNNNNNNNRSTTPSIMNLSSPLQLHQKQPHNISEWQLNVVLQRANLLQYYDTFISQGGDDVQQLLEAGEEEFLEIMALVGMASKPLHVRRLQKALQEYSANPVIFQLMAFQKSGLTPPPSLVIAAASLPPLPGIGVNAVASSAAAADALAAASSSASLSHYAAAVVAAVAQANEAYGALAAPPPLPPAPPATALTSSFNLGTNANSESPGMLSTRSDDSTAATNAWLHGGTLPDGLDGGAGGYENYSLPTTAPCLTDAQVQRIAECAQQLAINLPPDLEPKLVQSKKKVSREVMQMMENADAANRLDQCRKFARIYGRFDAKRKTDKPLTLHEVSVNEAAAQICLHRPALLTRRDELFPLARQVVRDAGYHYMKISTDQKRRSSPPESICSDFDESPAPSTSTASDLSPGGSSAAAAAAAAPLNNGSGESTATSNVISHCRRPSLSLLSGLPKKRRCLKEIGDEMQKIGREQDLCKMRVDEATDMVELHAIQRDLHRLTQRQIELSDEQADALQLMKKESVKVTKNGFEICNIFNHANVKRELTSSATPPNGNVEKFT